MSRYRKIDTRIWNDAKFRDLSDNGKLAFFMLLTHPGMTALGAMRGTVSGLAEELGWETEAFREAFREALSKGMAKHDPKACLIALPNFIRYNAPESPNVVKAWAGALDLLPECQLKNEVIQSAKAFAEGLSEAFSKALPEAFAKGMPYQEQEPEQEQEQEKSLESVGGNKPAPARDPTADPPTPTRSPPDGIPLDWQPGEQELTALRIRNIPPPDDATVSAFVGHWQGRHLESRQIHGKFLQWCAKDRAYRQADESKRHNGAHRPSDDIDQDEEIRKFIAAGAES